MTLPKFEQATIEPAKIRDYLLSMAHPVGRFKATFFLSLGYTAARWQQLRDDILKLCIKAEASPGQASAFGQKFDIDIVLIGPSGRSAAVRTVWIVGSNGRSPRFVTAFPR